MDTRTQYLNSQLALLRDLVVVDAYMDTSESGGGVPTLVVSDEDVERRFILQILRDDDGGEGGSFHLGENLLADGLARGPRLLPTVMLGSRTFFIDNRLRELRNVDDPHDRISFASRRGL